MERSKRTVILATVVLVIFHEVGFVGLNMATTRDLFHSLIPFNLMLSALVLAWFHREWSMSFIVFCFAVFWAGFGVEIAGVFTGKIFGVYRYGESLGPKLSAVPPVIGLNWLMVIYTSAMTAREFLKNRWVWISVGAAMATFLDFLIEPMAMKHDMWMWQDQSIPLQNYVAWYIVSWLMLFGFSFVEEKLENPMAKPYYLIQIAFFIGFWVISFALT